MKYIIFFCVLIAFQVISYPQEIKVEAPQIAIRIALGETADIGGTRITFAEVLEDSRCPVNVECVWAGRARVLIEVAEPGKPTVSKEVIFGQVKQNEVRDTLLVLEEEYTIEAMNLAPYPREPGEILEYSLLVKKTKKKN